MKVLLIGGPMDGYRRDWPSPSPNAQFYVRPNPETIFDPHFDPPDIIPIKTSSYRLQKLRENDKEYVVGVHSGVTITMEKLIKGYHGHRHRRVQKN